MKNAPTKEAQDITKPLLIVAIPLFLLLHQDWWFWKDRSLVFDTIPVGLAYHAGYAIAAAVLMSLLVRHLWPGHLENEEEFAAPPVHPAVESNNV